MKRALLQLMCLLMASVVLITSTGFGLIEHSCIVRGKKVSLVLGQVKHRKGCSMRSERLASSSPLDPKMPVIKKADCCQEDQRYENVSFTSSISQLVAKFIKATADFALDSVAVVFNWLLNGLLPTEGEPSIASVSSPTLHSGRDLLVFVQCFIL